MSAPPALAQSPRVTSAIFFLGALICVLGWRVSGGFSGAMGSDAALWGLTARDVAAGISAKVPPAYPALIALAESLGVGLVEAGWMISTAAMATLPVVIFWLARSLGASTPAASTAAIASLAHPDLFVFAHQVQPDAISVLLISGLALICLRPELRTWAAVLGALLLLFREHGLALWPALCVVIWRGSDTSRSRLWAIGVLVGLGWLAPLLVGQSPGLHPMDTAWSERTGGALQAFTTTNPAELSFLRELPREERLAYIELVLQQDRWGQLIWHIRRSLSQAWDLWALLSIATAMAIGRRQIGDHRPVWSTIWLTAALPALIIWSQTRHVALFVPISMAVIAACWPHSGRSRALVSLPLLGLLSPWPAHYSHEWDGQKGETIRAENLEELGQWICTEMPQGAYLGGFIQDVGLYCRLPRHDPDGSAADWRTFVVTDRPPPGSSKGSWSIVYGEDGPHQVYQLEPDREPRPCADASLDSQAPHLAVGRAAAVIDCTE